MGVKADNKHIIFDKKKNSLTIINGNTKVVMTLNSKKATLNKDTIVLNSAPIKYKNKIYIPLKGTAKLFKQQVAYDTLSNSVFIRNQKDYDKVKNIIENTISSFNKIKNLQVRASIDSKNNNSSIRTHYGCEIDINKNRMRSFISRDGSSGIIENIFYNDCIYSRDMDSKRLTKKHLTSEEYNNKINSFIFSKYNLSDILYCALSIKYVSNGKLTKLSGDIFISSDSDNIILAEPTKSKINIWIEDGSLLQFDRFYDEYKTLETKNNLYSTFHSICYETSQTDFTILLPNEFEVEFDTCVEAKEEGVWYFDHGNYDMAIHYYDQAIKIDPKYEIAYNNKGNALLQLGKYKEAIENYDKAIEINPNLSFVYFNKGLALNKTDAVECFLKAVDLEPDNYFYTAKAIDTLIFLERYDEALKCCDRFIEISPNELEIYLKKAKVLLFTEKYQEAIFEYDKALKLKPNDANILVSKGKTYNYFKKYDEAVECYNLAIKSDPDSAEAYYNKAIVLVKLSKLNDAIQSINNAIKIDNEYKEYFEDNEIFDSIRDKVE